jgi:hypothetical protein
MLSINSVAVILIILGLAIALPWGLYLVANRRARNNAEAVWQHSLDAVQKTLRGEAKDLDELSERVKKLKSESEEDQGK